MQEPDASPLTVAAFIGDAWEHACPTIRLTAPLQTAGIRLLRGTSGHDETIQIDLDAVDQSDLVVLQRDFPRHTALYDQVMKRSRALGRRVVYDIDDLLTELPLSHPGWQRYALETRCPLLGAVMEADCVTVTTDLLSEYFRPFQPNIWVLPNYLPDGLWPLEPPAATTEDAARPVVIGYLGSPAHTDDLLSIEPVLTTLLDRYGDRLALMLWGMDVPDCLKDRANVRSNFVGLVDYARFAEFFVRQHADIFIAPLLDNPFNRCKSPLKYFEYSACGKPGVFSAIPPYQDVVTHGRDGFLASTPADWERCLTSLIDDPQLRLQMGAGAQHTVDAGWRLSQRSALWQSLFRQVLALPPAPKPELVLRTVSTFGRWHGQMAERVTAADRQVIRLEGELADQRRQVASAKAELARSRDETRQVEARLEQKEDEAVALSNELYAVRHSRSWQVVTALYHARQLVAPSGSRREDAAKTIAKGVRVWRQHGLRQAFRLTGRKVRASSDAGAVAADAISPYALVDVQPGRPCPSPAISVVELTGPGRDQAAQADVAGWLTAQTCPGVEYVFWDGVHAATTGRDPWPAAGAKQLAAGLGGRYVCFASPHLVSQPSTYLEANLLALETEGLGFALNARGQAAWLLKQASGGALPCSPDFPLHRLVARTNLLTDGPSLDLSSSQQAGETESKAQVVGRVILHEASIVDPDDGVPAEPPAGQPLRLIGRHFVTGSSSGLPIHTIHPVDTVALPQPLPSDKPTVLLLIQFFAVGGAERVALDVIRALRDKVRFVAVSLDPHSDALGTTVDAFREQTPYVYSMADYLEPPLNVSFLHYLISRYQPQTLYVANGTNWIYDALPGLHRRYPRLRLANQVYDHEAGWINRYDPALAPIFDANVAVNQRICQAFGERGARPGTVFCIENGIDGAEFDPSSVSPQTIASLRSGLGIPAGARVVAMICRLHPQKRPMDFVELARRHASERGLFFLLVGDGPLSDRIQREMDRLRLPNLRRLPFYHPSRDIFALADVIVLPSEYEGMPMVVLEAQVMGKPVLVTDVGNNREIVELGCGVVVSAIGDVSVLDEGLKQALAMEVQPAELRERMLARFGLDVMAEHYYRALLGDADA